MNKRKMMSAILAILMCAGTMPFSTLATFAQDNDLIEKEKIQEQSSELKETNEVTEESKPSSEESSNVPVTEQPTITDDSTATEEPTVPEPEPAQPEETQPTEDEVTNPEVEQPSEEQKPEQTEQTPSEPVEKPESDSSELIQTEPVYNPNVTESDELKAVKPQTMPYVSSTWYHPMNLENLGRIGETEGALKRDWFLTRNYEGFLLQNNPFEVGQCTWYAWSRFYQIYGFDSGARGSGKYNAAEIVNAHPDKFALSSTPTAGAVFSMEKNSLFPRYGHVGIVEAFDGEYLWLSEGNYYVDENTGGYIWIHKVRWEDFKAKYPDVVFAVPKDDKKNIEPICNEAKEKLESKIHDMLAKIQMKRS